MTELTSRTRLGDPNATTLFEAIHGRPATTPEEKAIEAKILERLTPDQIRAFAPG